MKTSIDVYLPGYSNSDFMRPKKFSIMALSRQFPVSQKKELSCRLKCLWLNFFCKFLHFDLVGKNYFTIFAGGKGI